jgi:hypothetical protein
MDGPTFKSRNQLVFGNNGRLVGRNHYAMEEKLYYNITSCCGWHRLAVTQKGHLIFAPETTEVGDYVCVFKGGLLPYIVRSVTSISAPGQEVFRFVASVSAMA